MLVLNIGFQNWGCCSVLKYVLAMCKVASISQNRNCNSRMQNNYGMIYFPLIEGRKIKNHKKYKPISD